MANSKYTISSDRMKVTCIQTKKGATRLTDCHFSKVCQPQSRRKTVSRLLEKLVLRQCDRHSSMQGNYIKNEDQCSPSIASNFITPKLKNEMSPLNGHYAQREPFFDTCILLSPTNSTKSYPARTLRLRFSCAHVKLHHALRCTLRSPPSVG